MNKVFKVTGALVIIVGVIFVTAALMGPKECKMERSAIIHAPASVVFANISNYQNWTKWSPWKDKDTNCTYEYTGPQGQADAVVKWSGNEKAGEGQMHTTELAQDVSMVYHLNFIRPFKAECVGTFKLDSAGPGDTKLTWNFDMQIPFYFRPLALMMNMEKSLAPDYEKGLAQLKAVSESEATLTPVNKMAAADAKEVNEVKWTKKTYVAYRTKASFASVGDLFQKYMPKVGEYVATNKLEMDGPPSGLYFTWDTEKKMTDMAIAIPVKKADKVSGDFTIITVEASNGISSDYYGPYDKMDGVHALLNKFITDKKLKKHAPVIEEYVTDPGVEKDPNKVLTKVTYLID